MIPKLVKEVKKVDAELLELKTVHKRGLDNLKIYKYKVSIDTSGHQSGSWGLSVTANFSSNFGAYPFATAYPAATSNFAYSARLLSEAYSNNGMSLVANFVWVYNSSLSDQSVYILSSSPVDSASYNWSSI